MVVARPTRKGDNYWECVVRLVDNNYDTILDVSACQPGDKTRWITANMPEMHELLTCLYIIKYIRKPV
jgi:hypothetical protein